MCADITGFFDNLSIEVLKQNWNRVWSGRRGGVLEDDHYKVFKSLKNFHFVEEKDIVCIFKKEPREGSDINWSDSKARKKELNRSLHERICSFQKLRSVKSANNNKNFIRNKSKLKITGIPQGTAISGMLANISMIDFDLAMKTKIEKLGGFFRRYSDDIFIAFPSTVNFGKIEKFINSLLKKYFNEYLHVNPDKTNRSVYEENEKGEGACYNDEGKLSSAQYLGFEFDGKRIHVRSSSISRNRSKIVRVIKKNKKGKSGKSKLGNINTRKVYKAQSPRKITPADQYKQKGFVFYGKRSEKIQNAPEIKKQISKNDRFIKKMIDEERKPAYQRKSKLKKSASVN